MRRSVVIAVAGSDNEAMPLSSLSRLLVDDPELTERLTIDSLFQIFRLIHHLKENLSWHLSPDSKDPPLLLPRKIRGFYAAALDMEDQGLVSDCWATFRNVVWGMNATNSRKACDLVDLFLKHGVKHGVGTLCSFVRSKIFLCTSPQASRICTPRRENVWIRTAREDTTGCNLKSC